VLPLIKVLSILHRKGPARLPKRAENSIRLTASEQSAHHTRTTGDLPTVMEVSRVSRTEDMAVPSVGQSDSSG
jgi:hypothetical protein